MTTPRMDHERSPGRSVGDVLAVGFGTSATMWTVAYALRLVEQHVTSPRVVFSLICAGAVLLLACHVVGGFLLGRYALRGVAGAGGAGFVSGLINLLAVASAFSGDRPNQVRPSAPLWIGGTLLLATALTAFGAWLGGKRRPTGLEPPDWSGGLALVAACAAFILLGIGGFVTGLDEGLAVVDWPNTETYNMFLYPLSRMTGGVFLEHSHRLFGSLVGLTTLVLAIQVLTNDRRRHVKLLAVAALVFVIVQGVLGGLRVTGRFTLSADPADTRPSVVFAIVHGAFGQIVFGTLVVLAVFRSRSWRETISPHPAPGASTDHVLAVVLIALLLVQLVAGALVRHFSWALYKLRFELPVAPEHLIAAGHRALTVHVTLAVLVTLAASAAGIRAWGLYPHVPPLRRLGTTLLALVVVQLGLGIGALVVTGNDAPNNQPGLLDALVTTAHQVLGAALLALALLLLLWEHRLLAAPVATSSATPASLAP
jgi:cytochrome c oxidase assembly protein subunit 15